MASKELVKLRDLRRQIRVTKTIYPRLDVIRRSVERMGVGLVDQDGDWAVPKHIAEVLKENYRRTGIFGRRKARSEVELLNAN
jgi:hypothetical protein